VKITIDASSALLRSAGVKGYTYHWLRSLRQQAAHGKNAGDEIRAFPLLKDWTTLDHEHSAVPLLSTIARLAALHAANVLGSPVLDLLLGRTDIFHAGNLVRQAPGKARLTATIHDLTSWIMPQVHTQSTLRADRTFEERILKRAHGLIAVSENTRQDAIRLLGIEPERIRTIHSGVAEQYFDAGPSARTKPYVLFVGTVEPRKNLNTLLDAWRSVKHNIREHFDLVIAGPQGWNSSATMARIRQEVTYLGYFPEADMPGLVAGASLFVYPSLYEGFGFPLVQAMAANVPVLSSQTSCLPEIAGDAAAFVDPLSPSDMSAQLTRLLESPEERSRLAQLGRARAERYRWERCARESLAFFRDIAAL
jgi:glycosyltransferase involved in cell wall biosynthesis